jgi:hypothetical protein
MPMSQRTMSRSRTSARLPYARPDIVTEVALPPNSTEPVIKKSASVLIRTTRFRLQKNAQR